MRFHVQPHLPTLLKISSVKYSQSIYSLFFRMNSSTLGLNTKFCTHFLSSHHEYTNNVVCKGLPCFPRFFVQGNLSPVNTKRKNCRAERMVTISARKRRQLLLLTFFCVIHHQLQVRSIFCCTCYNCNYLRRRLTYIKNSYSPFFQDQFFTHIHTRMCNYSCFYAVTE